MQNKSIKQLKSYKHLSNPNAMQQIKTPDGSVTFHNTEFDEAYHSKSGAKEEAVKKFVEPCQIKEIAKTGSVKILDFCFGLGYNTAAAIDAILEENPTCKIEVIGLEKDPKILEITTDLDAPFTHFALIQEMIKNNYKYKDENIKIKLILGDAVQTITILSEQSKERESFDAIFFDPFSPKKCPELWTEEVFRECYRLLNKNGRLATYSCARVVRDNLKKAGFTIIDGPKLWRRGPSTIALK